ncbi:MAG: hypothetical protein Tsb002_14040 [Wenzhouxiangellaceae bacterium]
MLPVSFVNYADGFNLSLAEGDAPGGTGGEIGFDGTPPALIINLLKNLTNLDPMFYTDSSRIFGNIPALIQFPGDKGVVSARHFRNGNASYINITYAESC